MNDDPILLAEPLPTLRLLVSASGSRAMLAREHLLDRLRADRRGSPYEIRNAIDVIERRLAKALRDECGDPWVDLFERCWDAHFAALRRVAGSVDAIPPVTTPRKAIDAAERTSVPPSPRAIVRTFDEQLALGWLRAAREAFDAPPLEAWFDAPLGAWLDHAVVRHRLDPGHARTGLACLFEVSPRTLERRLAGRASRRAPLPTAAFVLDWLRGAAARPIHAIDRQASQETNGWLALALAFQAIRDRRRTDMLERYRAYDESVDEVLTCALNFDASRRAAIGGAGETVLVRRDPSGSDVRQDRAPAPRHPVQSRLFPATGEPVRGPPTADPFGHCATSIV